MSLPTQIPQTQKAWRVVAQGPPSKALRLDKELPVPTQLDKGNVLVKVQAAALNPVGYKLMKLLPNFVSGRPFIAEQDFSGIVVDANGTNFANGDEVFGWIPVDLNRKTKYGALSEYTVAPAGNLAIRPPNISATQASGISLAGMTAYQALFQSAQLEEGQSLFVNGGSTTVGSYAIQFAKATGVKVVASASEKNKDFVLGLGADEFVDYTKQDLATFFSQNPPSPKFNVILDAVGLADGSLYAKSEKYLAPGGVFVSVGPTPTGWSSTLQLLKLITDLVRPTWLGGVRRKWTMVMVSHKDEDLEAMRKLIADGKVKPVVDSVHAFDDAINAYDRITSMRATGKVVVKVDPRAE
ncbi:quinone oxidoreductase 6 [Heterobasidion irregulare TC 32-1]|uniref:Quinone oxidoreductase 6 n=1 Tax=Heterobasidion irregulare (strain TC 32-1) TaxID=747525 RepID=W4KKA8_HETIT|nr:quinone oxidoreductase 6 [Heterobasidion irregulare TC 32-1]ETW85496.1 quinone oxidoreductase 6 [Heterobasidion irregulare TC 32-1]